MVTPRPTPTRDQVIQGLSQAMYEHIASVVEPYRQDLESLTYDYRELDKENDRLTLEAEDLETKIEQLSIENQELKALIEELKNPTPPPDPTPSPEEPRTYEMIFGGATVNNQADFDKLNDSWGPIRMSREYDWGTGCRLVNNYAWYEFVKRNFKYLAFSWDEPYGQIAAGQHDGKIEAMLNSLPTALPGVKGTILLGNEPNKPSKGVDPSSWRAAMEHLLDTFGDEPAPGFHWGIAFTNYVSWGQGRTDGEAWLPRRPDMRFVMETHVYGSTHYADPASALRTFLPAVRRRPAWLWGIGETSAQEHSSNPDKKGQWLANFADYTAQEGGIYFLPFDTNVGGSADVGTTPRTAYLVKQAAERYAANEWKP